MDDKNNASAPDGKQDSAGSTTRTKSRRPVIGVSAAIAVIACLVVGAAFLAPRPGATAGEGSSAAQPQTPPGGEPTDAAGQADACEHDWTMTYKTVHHDAVTHTENVAPVYESKTEYHTVCNDCQQVIDGIADQHIKDTGHSGYSTNVPISGEVLVSEGYSHEVTDTPAYDETVPDALVCAICGATKPADGAHPAA